MSRKDAATALGLSYIDKGEHEFRDAWTSLPEVAKNGTIRHIIFGSINGIEATAFQHSMVVQTGQVPVTVVKSIYTCETPLVPHASVRTRSALGSILLRFGLGRGVPSGDPVFDAKWRVVCDEWEFARALLTPDLRSHISTKRAVVWRLHDGRLCLIYRGKMRAERVGASFARLMAFRGLASVALDEYEGSA